MASRMTSNRTSKGRGGARRGAGRPRDPNAGAPHLARPDVSDDVVHAWWTTRDRAPSLLRSDIARAMREAIEAGSERNECRVVFFRLQSDRLDVMCEAENALALSRCLQGLGIRTAKAVNRIEGTRGKIFADRYRQRVLKTSEVAAVAKELQRGHGGVLATPKHRALRSLSK